MSKKLVFIMALLITCWFGAPRAVFAGSLDEMQTAVNSYYNSGAISDPDIKGTLLSIVNKAKLTTDAQAVAAYRASFIDVVNAFEGAGITTEAAAALLQVAQP